MSRPLGTPRRVPGVRAKRLPSIIRAGLQRRRDYSCVTPHCLPIEFLRLNGYVVNLWVRGLVENRQEWQGTAMAQPWRSDRPSDHLIE